MGKDLSTRFKPGQSGNPKGRPPMPPEMKALKTRSREEVEFLILKFYNKTEYELEKVYLDSKSTMMEKHVARIMAKGLAKGDHVSFGFLSDYVFGKKAEVIDLQSSDRSMSPNSDMTEMIKSPDTLKKLMEIESEFRNSTSEK